MREYRLPKFWRVVSHLFSVGFILLALYLVYLGIMSDKQVLPLLPFYGGAVVLAALAWYVYKDAKVGKLILEDDRVTLISPLGTKSLHKDDIRGFREVENYIIVEPRDHKQSRLRISTYFEKRNEIRRWFDLYITNLEVAEWQEEVIEVLSDEELGLFSEDRVRKLDIARKVARGINISAWVVCGWIIFYPKPYELAAITGIALPWIAMTANYTYRNLMKGGDRDKSAYPSVTEGFVLPGFALLLRFLFDYDILEYSNAWVMVGVLTITMFILFQLPIKGFSPRSGSAVFLLILFPLFTFIYSLGTIMLINCMADKSEPAHYTSTILSKRISKGKTTSYYFDLAPWADLTEEESVRVSSHEYDQASPGDTVSIKQYKGAFKIPWIEVSL